jgi:hypothetical protein
MSEKFDSTDKQKQKHHVVICIVLFFVHYKLAHNK